MTIKSEAPQQPETRDYFPSGLKKWADALPLLAGSGLRAPEGLALFSRSLAREVARTRRGHSTGGVLVMIEFDNGPGVLERHGEGAHECCVKLISGLLDSEIRAMDVAARLDRDGFVLLLADTDAARATQRVQSLLLRLNNLSLIWQLREIQISVSLGIKAYAPEDFLPQRPHYIPADIVAASV